MQIAGADAVLTAQTPSSGSSVVNKVKQLAERMSDGSSASDLEKINAYNAINRLTGPGSTYYQDTTQEERDYINDIRFNSEIGQAVVEMADRVKRMTMAMDPSTNIPERELAYVNSLSEVEKQVFFGSRAINNYNTFDDWKAERQQDVATYAEYLDTGHLSQSSVNVTLSDEAKQALEAETGAEKALKTLEAANEGVSGASAALSILERAAETRARDSEERRQTEADAQSRNRPARLYEAGDNLSKAV